MRTAVLLSLWSLLAVSSACAAGANPFYKDTGSATAGEVRALQAEMQELRRLVGSGSAAAVGDSTLPPLPGGPSAAEMVRQAESATYRIAGRVGGNVLLSTKDDSATLQVEDGAAIDGCQVRYPYFWCAPAGSASAASSSTTGGR